MKIRAGKKLCGRKPTQAPPSAAHEQRGGDRQGLAVGVGEHVGEGEERDRADADHAGGQPVEAVDEVDRVDRADDQQDRQEHGLRRGRGEN